MQSQVQVGVQSRLRGFTLNADGCLALWADQLSIDVDLGIGGAHERAADWTAMFERQIAEHGWRDVLAAWWPRRCRAPSVASPAG